MSKRTLFGTDGIRGTANKHPITCEVAFALGRAVTNFFQRKKRGHRPIIVIGKDTRVSCYMLEQAFSAGVCSQGGHGILTGPLPTPGVAFVVESMRADAGVMISASHNKFQDNGIKIFDSKGHKLPDKIEAELEKSIQNPELIEVKFGDELGSTDRLDEVIGRYIVHVKSCINKKVNFEGLRLVIDCANGASYKVAPMIFRELGADVVPIAVSPNGRNINDHCGATYPEVCAENVVKYRADLGICLDGDADRLIMIDHKGQIINGDQLIGICAKFFRDKGIFSQDNSEIVGTIMSNLGLERYLNDLGLKFHRTKVGDRYIIERMLQSGSILGGEPSGHMIFKSFSTTGDGIISAIKVIEGLKFYNKTLNEMANEVKMFPQVSKSIQIKNRPPLESIPAIVKAKEKIQNDLGEQSRIVMRYSGTEPIVRIMIEGENEKKICRASNNLQDVLAKELK